MYKIPKTSKFKVIIIFFFTILWVDWAIVFWSSLGFLVGLHSVETSWTWWSVMVSLTEPTVFKRQKNRCHPLKEEAEKKCGNRTLGGVKFKSLNR